MATSRPQTLYILELESGRYYVGLTDDLHRRFRQHKEGATEWTKRYKPVRVYWFAENKTSVDEETFTISMMKYKGIDNVRGSIYSQMRLLPQTRDLLEDKISAMNHCCFKCGGRNHFRSDCDRMGVDLCIRCGRQGHDLQNCFAVLDILSNRIGDGSDEEDDMISVAGCREYDTSDEELNPRCLSRQISNANACMRCGRNNHRETQCFAKCDFRGRPLQDNYR